MAFTKVLIVDDEVVSRKMLKKYVESFGYVALQAVNGRQALELLNANTDIEAVVTDYIMPEIDGRQLLEKMQENPKFQNLPVIMISGIVKYQEITDLLENGANFFLSKPINKTHLEEYLRKIVPLPSLESSS